MPLAEKRVALIYGHPFSVYKGVMQPLKETQPEQRQRLFQQQFIYL